MRTAAQISLRIMQSSQGLHCPLIESLDITECINGEQMPGWYFAQVQDDLYLSILRVFEGKFSLDAANLKCLLLIMLLEEER